MNSELLPARTTPQWRRKLSAGRRSPRSTKAKKDTEEENKVLGQREEAGKNSQHQAKEEDLEHIQNIIRQHYLQLNASAAAQTAKTGQYLDLELLEDFLEPQSPEDAALTRQLLEASDDLQNFDDYDILMLADAAASQLSPASRNAHNLFGTHAEFERARQAARQSNRRALTKVADYTEHERQRDLQELQRIVMGQGIVESKTPAKARPEQAVQPANGDRKTTPIHGQFALNFLRFAHKQLKKSKEHQEKEEKLQRMKALSQSLQVEDQGTGRAGRSRYRNSVEIFRSGSTGYPIKECRVDFTKQPKLLLYQTDQGFGDQFGRTNEGQQPTAGTNKRGLNPDLPQTLVEGTYSVIKLEPLTKQGPGGGPGKLHVESVLSNEKKEEDVDLQKRVKFMHQLFREERQGENWRYFGSTQKNFSSLKPRSNAYVSALGLHPHVHPSALVHNPAPAAVQPRRSAKLHFLSPPHMPAKNRVEHIQSRMMDRTAERFSISKSRAPGLTVSTNKKDEFEPSAKLSITQLSPINSQSPTRDQEPFLPPQRSGQNDPKAGTRSSVAARTRQRGSLEEARTDYDDLQPQNPSLQRTAQNLGIRGPQPNASNDPTRSSIDKPRQRGTQQGTVVIPQQASDKYDHTKTRTHTNDSEERSRPCNDLVVGSRRPSRKMRVGLHQLNDDGRPNQVRHQVDMPPKLEAGTRMGLNNAASQVEDPTEDLVRNESRFGLGQENGKRIDEDAALRARSALNNGKETREGQRAEKPQDSNEDPQNVGQNKKAIVVKTQINVLNIPMNPMLFDKSKQLKNAKTITHEHTPGSSASPFRIETQPNYSPLEPDRNSTKSIASANDPQKQKTTNESQNRDQQAERIGERALHPKNFKMPTPPRNRMDGPRVRGEDVVRRQMQLLGHFKALGLIPQDFSDFKKFQHILDDPVLSGILQNKVKEHLALQKQELAKRNASLPSPRHKVPSHFVRQAKRNSAITQVGKPSKIPQKDDDLAKSIQLDDGLDRYLRQRSFQAYRSSVDTGRKTASKLNRTIDFSRITQPDIIIKKYELQKAPPDQPKKKQSQSRMAKKGKEQLEGADEVEEDKDKAEPQRRSPIAHVDEPEMSNEQTSPRNDNDDAHASKNDKARKSNLTVQSGADLEQQKEKMARRQEQPQASVHASKINNIDKLQNGGQQAQTQPALHRPESSFTKQRSVNIVHLIPNLNFQGQLSSFSKPNEQWNDQRKSSMHKDNPKGKNSKLIKQKFNVNLAELGPEHLFDDSQGRSYQVAPTLQEAVHGKTDRSDTGSVVRSPPPSIGKRRPGELEDGYALQKKDSDADSPGTTARPGHLTDCTIRRNQRDEASGALLEASSPRLSKDTRPRVANQRDTVLMHAHPSAAGSSSEKRPARGQQESPLTEESSQKVLQLNAEAVPRTAADAQSPAIHLHPDLVVNIKQQFIADPSDCLAQEKQMEPRFNNGLKQYKGNVRKLKHMQALRSKTRQSQLRSSAYGSQTIPDQDGLQVVVAKPATMSLAPNTQAALKTKRPFKQTNQQRASPTIVQMAGMVQGRDRDKYARDMPVRPKMTQRPPPEPAYNNQDLELLRAPQQPPVASSYLSSPRGGRAGQHSSHLHPPEDFLMMYPQFRTLHGSSVGHSPRSSADYQTSRLPEVPHRRKSDHRPVITYSLKPPGFNYATRKHEYLRDKMLARNTVMGCYAPQKGVSPPLLEPSEYGQLLIRSQGVARGKAPRQ